MLIPVEASYPIRAVSRITGLSIDTLRAWERRYGAVTPEHSARGRQYGQAEIDRLILLRDVVSRGHQIGSVAGLDNDNLRKLLEGSIPARPVPLAETGDLITSVLAAIENYDHAEAEDELGRIAALLPPRDLIYQVVLPLMRTVGERWYAGQLSVAQEHMVSAMMRSLLGTMLRMRPGRRGAPKVVILAPASELHEFGILAAAMIAAIAGLNPVYLGPNLPSSDALKATQQVGARFMAVGLSGAVLHAGTEVRKLAQVLPPDVELWIGGNIEPFDFTELGPKVHLLESMEAFEELCRKTADRPAARI